MTPKQLENALPHGAGIDDSWKCEDHGRNITCYNSFHVMDDRGYYVGWADFSIVIPKRNPVDFKLHFHGASAQYFARRYDLRWYLEDILAEYLSG